jgi:opacity protein-like surface antigen
MKKGLLIALALVVLSPIVVSAQDFPKAEIYGGYMLIHEQGITTNGFLAAVEGNINKNFGIVGEFGYGADTPKGEVDGVSASVKLKEYNVLAGPRVSYRTDKYRVFAHALFGYNRMSASGIEDFATGASNDFAMAYGGGVDVSASKLISIRLAQVDWLITHWNIAQSSGWSGQLRYSGGVVLKLGGK